MPLLRWVKQTLKYSSCFWMMECMQKRQNPRHLTLHSMQRFEASRLIQFKRLSVQFLSHPSSPSLLPLLHSLSSHLPSQSTHLHSTPPSSLYLPVHSCFNLSQSLLPPQPLLQCPSPIPSFLSQALHRWLSSLALSPTSRKVQATELPWTLFWTLTQV